MTMGKLEVLAEYFPVDQVLEDHEINPIIVYEFLMREGLIDIDRYFLDEEEYDE